MSQIASCPVCWKVFRPRSMAVDAAWCSVLQHLKEMARGGSPEHLLLHSALFGRRGGFGCPGCDGVWVCKELALQHFAGMTDAAHTACRCDMPAVASRHTPALRSRSGNSREESLLYSAAKSGRYETVQTLLAANVNPNAGGEDGFTPLMTAAEAGHASVIALLAQDPRCQLNSKNSYGQTALAFAAQNGRTDAVLELMKYNVDLEELCNGSTAAEIARKAGHTQIADIVAGAAQDLQVSRLLEVLISAPRAFDSTSARICSLFSLSKVPNPLSARLSTAQQDLDMAREAIAEASQERDAARQRAAALAARIDHLQEALDSLRRRSASAGGTGGGGRSSAAAAASHVDPAGGRSPVLCVICMEGEVRVAVTPCFHAALCAGCAEAAVGRGRACPVCRGPAEGKQRIYLP